MLNSVPWYECMYDDDDDDSDDVCVKAELKLKMVSKWYLDLYPSDSRHVQKNQWKRCANAKPMYYEKERKYDGMSIVLSCYAVGGCLFSHNVKRRKIV